VSTARSVSRQATGGKDTDFYRRRGIKKEALARERGVVLQLRGLSCAARSRRVFAMENLRHPVLIAILSSAGSSKLFLLPAEKRRFVAVYITQPTNARGDNFISGAWPGLRGVQSG
jgi:hypothetical protein